MSFIANITKAILEPLSTKYKSLSCTKNVVIFVFAIKDAVNGKDARQRPNIIEGITK